MCILMDTSLAMIKNFETKFGKQKKLGHRGVRILPSTAT